MSEESTTTQKEEQHETTISRQRSSSEAKSNSANNKAKTSLRKQSSSLTRNKVWADDLMDIFYLRLFRDFIHGDLSIYIGCYEEKFQRKKNCIFNFEN